MPRMRPMMEDQTDRKTLRDMTHDFSQAEYGAAVPMFFSRYGASLELAGHYYGAACFLVSNGPSLLKLDLNLLRTPGVMVFSMNNGAATLLQAGVTPNFWTCVDQPSRFVMQIWNNPAICKFIPAASLDKPLWDNEKWAPMNKRPRDCPNVVTYRRNEKFAGHRFWGEASLNWGCHKKYGGCRTVLLPSMRIPYLLGFRKLYLLGVDLKMDESAKYHFAEGRTRSAIHGNAHTYERLLREYLPQMQAGAKTIGYQIYNCNPDSAVKCFEARDFAEAVKEAAGQCGPTAKIGTEGMYVEWDKKVGLTREQAKQATGLCPG